MGGKCRQLHRSPGHARYFRASHGGDQNPVHLVQPGGSDEVKVPLSAFAADLGDHTIRTALCPGGKEHMRRVMDVIQGHRVDLGGLVTHQWKLDDMVEASVRQSARWRAQDCDQALKP